jgi:hypothetical protein
MTQLLLHLWGDYLLQSQWMAENKTKRWWPAIVHGTVYSLPFLLIGSIEAVLVIWSTHIVIDRFRLARFLVWGKNFLAPPAGCPCGTCRERRAIAGKWVGNLPWSECSATGYAPDMPPWLAVWLLIIADNTIHLTINFLSLRFLP